MIRWVVVGGGSAGCVVAARLSERSDHDVTLLEAGPDHGAAAEFAVAGTTGRSRRPVLAEPSMVRSGVRVIRRPGAIAEPYLQGFGLGGSSLVNGGIVIGDPTVESVGHELPIELVTVLGPVARAVLDEMPDATRVGLVQRAGRRVSAADEYLRPAIGRPNLTVRPDTEVAEIVFDSRRPVGVRTATGDDIAADRIVMCAGAIDTPAILLRSGAVVPALGEHLQDHAGLTISFDLPGDVDSAVPAIGVTVERPGRQIVVIDRLPGAQGMGAVIAGHLAVVGEGSVTVDPLGLTVVELGQLTDPADLDGLAGVAREVLTLLQTERLRAVIGDCYVDSAGTHASTLAGDERALRMWLPDHLGGYHHLAGSCRIGVCLEDDGALRGYHDVYVCDAAALPGVPARNPYLTVIRLAEAMCRRWNAA